MTSQHIGAAGELLVQYKLLKLGIDSARLTTDSGVDLVIYSSSTSEATTVQVKTARSLTPAGGRGKPAVGWNFPHELGAQMLAVTVLSLDEVWLFTRDEARDLARQHTKSGYRRLYWYGGDYIRQNRDGFPLRQSDMQQYLLRVRANRSATGWR